jgi:Ni,Fe-hydrogenase I small subunit
MAITRRQFVATLGSMAAALGLSQADLTKVTEVFGTAYVKPKVLWVHGAECTGCSTSSVGLFEDAVQDAFPDPNDALYSAGYSVLDALGLVVGAGNSVPRTINANHANYDSYLNGGTLGAGTQVTIQDVLIDILDLEYHETIMGPGGDLAYQFLNDNIENGSAADFVLVVEGAIQVKSAGGAWSDVSDTDVPWCSIGKGAISGELSFDHVVAGLASQDACLAVIAIGQCACYGGYPKCVSPAAEFNGMSQSPAYGTYEFLSSRTLNTFGDYGSKVVNVPGCPANPWWFVLTVVLFLAGVMGDVDYGQRLARVYPTTVHGGLCPRYNDFMGGRFAAAPGDSGCLMKIGCKGISTKSLCALHGWNGRSSTGYRYKYSQIGNDTAWDNNLNELGVAFCVAAGAPCMGCTEKGYPDHMVPFVSLV